MINSKTLLIHLKFQIVKLGANPVCKEDLQVLELKTSIKSMEERLAKQQQELNRLMTEVKANKNTNKKLALSSLRTAKRKQQEITKLMGVIENLWNMKSKIEEATLNVKAISAVQGANQHLKTIQTEDMVEKAADALQELQDQILTVDDTSAALSASIDGTVLDESELERELTALSIAEKPQEKERITASSDMDIQLPMVPKDLPRAKHTKEEKFASPS